jgi:hypothetical protein
LIVHLKWDWVHPSAFAWVIVSSDTWGSFLLWFSCYSWWLPPPRQLQVAEECWHELVIVHADTQHSCEGFLCLPRGRLRKATLVDCDLCTLILCWFLWRLCVRLGLCMPISVWATKWVCRHNVD